MYLDMATDLLSCEGRVRHPERIKFEHYKAAILGRMKEKCKTPELCKALEDFKKRMEMESSYDESFIYFYRNLAKGLDGKNE